MNKIPGHGTLLQVPLLQESYGRAFVVSLGIHTAALALFLVAPYLLPRTPTVFLGTGPGGGTGGASYTVGVADELAGGAGMIKPSLVPQPPALASEKPEKEQVKQEAIPLPNTVEPKKAPPRTESRERARSEQTRATPNTNVIPTRPQPGAGGMGGMSGGSGGGRGSGVGVSLGSGSGGMGDFWYARMVEQRIGSNWIKPVTNERVEIVYSFFITDDGTIRDLKKEKSSGNDLLDLTAERAIRASSSPPLPPLPPQLRGRPVRFVAQFIHPPSP